MGKKYGDLEGDKILTEIQKIFPNLSAKEYSDIILVNTSIELNNMTDIKDKEQAIKDILATDLLELQLTAANRTKGKIDATLLENYTHQMNMRSIKNIKNVKLRSSEEIDKSIRERKSMYKNSL